MKRRLIDTTATVLIAWPLVTAIFVADKIAGRIIDARACRWPNVTGGEDE